jgi:hypothetical protein
MAITTPDAVPGEVIEAAWGDAVRADLTALDSGKYAKTGGAITGAVNIAGRFDQSGGSVTLASTDFRVTRPGTARPFIGFWNDANTVRQAAVVGAADGLELACDRGPIKLMPTDGTNAAEAARLDVNNLFLGKTSSNLQTQGFELQHSGGTLRGTMSVASVSLYANHISAANVNGCMFAQFLSSGTQIGSIAQLSTTGVAYNTTSDKRLKAFTRIVDPDEAVAKLMRVEPVQFTWRGAPADGEQLGFFAQDLVNVAPEAVTVGQGEPGDADLPDGLPGFVPWSVDHSKLVPTLVAAVQALTRRIETLEAI